MARFLGFNLGLTAQRGVAGVPDLSAPVVASDDFAVSYDASGRLLVTTTATDARFYGASSGWRLYVFRGGVSVSEPQRWPG